LTKREEYNNNVADFLMHRLWGLYPDLPQYCMSKLHHHRI